jgi:hypothetical protein
MPRRTISFPPKTTGSITGVLLVSSLILILWSRGGGPVWTAWLGFDGVQGTQAESAPESWWSTTKSKKVPVSLSVSFLPAQE